STLPGFYPFLTVLNPNTSTANLTITYTPDDRAPIVRTLSVPPTSRLTVQVYGPVEQGGVGDEITGFGIYVTSNLNVLVERPFYVYRQLPDLPVINGGSDVIGLRT